MLNIYLLRHGEVEGGPMYRGSQDDPLTDKGLQQMLKAFNTIPHCIHHIFSSPLQRCAVFSQHLAISSLPLSLEPRFKEIHFGDWEGKRFDQICASDLNQYFDDPYKNTPPQAEQLVDFDIRVISAWNAILKDQNRDSNYLIITHAGVMRSILMHCCAINLQSAFKFNIAHACIIHLKVGFENNQPFVQLINFTNLAD